MEKRKVLFVDDEQGILRSIKRSMRSEPFHSLFAGNGHEAIQILQKEKVQVVVSDLNMPEMDGLTLLRKVADHDSDIIRLILSGQSETMTILDAINEGNIYRYILKPWNDLDLKITIHQSIDLYNIKQERKEYLVKLKKYSHSLEETVKKRTKEILAIQNKAEIGKYASQIVNNLNNPLQDIRGWIDLSNFVLIQDNPDLTRLKDHLNFIQSGICDIEDQIAAILNHVRKDTLIKNEPIDINKIIKKELIFYENNSGFKKIEKKLVLADSLPFIMGNPAQIKQLFDNILKNSIDALSEAKPKRLAVKTCSDAKFIIIKITDTGKGISREHLPRIFFPGFTTKSVGKGSGLGLASVKAMIEAYGGRIRIESKKDVGTSVIMSIPYQ